MYTAFKDYYKLLEISFPATESEIKAAYRRMAREYHPDLHPEDPEHYTARFQAITEAYQTLSDPLKRKATTTATGARRCRNGPRYIITTMPRKIPVRTATGIRPGKAGVSMCSG